MSDKKEIQCFGNSHVRYVLDFKQKPDEIVEHEYENIRFRGMQTGNTGATAWSLTKDSSRTDAGQKIRANFKQGSDILLAYGEVDVREHIHKHRKNGTVQAVLDVINRYEEFIKTLSVGKCILFGTLPYTRKFHSARPSSGDYGCYYTIAPVIWNGALAELCQKNGWHYIDLYEKFIDNEHFLLDEFSEEKGSVDAVHMNSNAFSMIFEQIKRLY